MCCASPISFTMRTVASASAGSANTFARWFTQIVSASMIGNSVKSGSELSRGVFVRVFGATSATTVQAVCPCGTEGSSRAAPVVKHEETRAAATSARSGSTPVAAQSATPQFDRAPTQTASAQSGAALPVPPPFPSPATTDATITTTPRQEDRAVQEPPRAPEPPQRTLQELVVSANSVIGLQTENRISSETARVEDRVEARVTRDVKVGDMVAIPAGSRVIGSVTAADRGGKFKERARLGIRFHTLVLPDGTRLPMSTETIYREGESPSDGSAAKIGGGAVGGAILGAILGGAKGAAIGAAAGAGGGAAVTAAGDRSAAALPAGTPMTVRILAPVTITVER